MIVTLLPAENIALTIAAAQLRRGETLTPNVATMLVLTLERLTGVDDWTKRTAESGLSLAPREEYDQMEMTT